MLGRLRGTAVLYVLWLAACSGDDSEPTQPSTPNTPSASEVLVQNDVFTPSSRDAAVGGTVTWTWQSNGLDHSVTFDDGGPSSPVQGTGSFSRSFATAGSFPYRCTVHPTMTGVVNVGQSGTGGTGGGGNGGGGTGGGYYQP